MITVSIQLLQNNDWVFVEDFRFYCDKFHKTEKKERQNKINDDHHKLSF